MEDRLKIDKIVDWINNYLKATNSAGFIFGLSGGIDSALVASIASKYFPKNHLALRMNYNSCDEDILDQKILIKHFDLNYKNIFLDDIVSRTVNELKLEKNIILNLSSRLRMVCLYSLAEKLNYLVMGTSNYNEIYTGYFTKYGDGASDFLPLGNLTKFDIWKLSKFMDVPQKIIDKAPSAGLYPGQTDEKDLGISYKDMEDYFRKKNIDKNISDNMEKLHNKTRHKRIFPMSVLKINEIL
ncbi:MAG: NAD(+) synthase [Mycoplasmoidaceae bacterium]